MKTLTRTELERSLLEEPKPLYLLVGTERYLRDAAARSLTEAGLRGTLLREFNEARFYLLRDSVPSAAAAAAEHLPLMSERRVIRVRDFARLREADEETLVRYLNNPSPATVMIFVADD